MIRPATRSPKPGEKTTTSTPTKNRTASTTIEMRPIRLRCGPGVSGGSVDSPMLVECVLGGLLRLQPLVVPQPSSLQVYMSASRGFPADGAGKVKAMGDGGQGGVAVVRRAEEW